LLKIDEFVTRRNFRFSVIPAQAGIQLFKSVMDPGFRQGDGLKDFLRTHQAFSFQKTPA